MLTQNTAQQTMNIEGVKSQSRITSTNTCVFCGPEPGLHMLSTAWTVVLSAGPLVSRSADYLCPANIVCCLLFVSFCV